MGEPLNSCCISDCKQISVQESKIIFTNNTAMLAGAGIYASDMSRCKWLGNLTGNYTIFQIPPDKGPFHFSNNTVQDISSSSVNNNNLATESSQFSAVANVNGVCFLLGLCLTLFHATLSVQHIPFHHSIW